MTIQANCVQENIKILFPPPNDDTQICPSQQIQNILKKPYLFWYGW